MSYTDLLQSYQDRMTSMLDTEDNIGSYLLNQSQAKMDDFLKQAGIPSEIGAGFEQIGLIANSAPVQTLLQKSGLKGVLDQKLEAVNRNFEDLKNQLKTAGDSAARAVDETVSSARQTGQNILNQSQQVIDTARAGEDTLRETGRQAQQAVSEARGQAEQAVSDVRGQAEQAVSDVRGQAEQAVSGARAQAEQAVSGARAQAEQAVSDAQTTLTSPSQRLTPEYLQNLSDDELKQAMRQASTRRQTLSQQFETSELSNREDVFRGLASETKQNILSIQEEGRRRMALRQSTDEVNLRPSQIQRDLPQFESPTQQLPTIPQQPVEAPATPPRPAPESEIEPAIGPEPRPEGYVMPEPEVQSTEEAIAPAVSDTERAISTVAKIGTGLEETTFELPDIGEATEVLGALLQVGSLIAGAFAPHEQQQTISTPVAGFGFGALNQYGIGGTSIV
jgi:hypothetical protein